MRKSYYLKLLATFSVIFFCTQIVMAQYTVSGTVTDASTGETLVGVTIFDAATNTGTSTNVDGEYSLELPAGTTSLRFSSVGFSTQNVEVSGAEGDEVTLDVELRPDVANLEELVVTGLASSVKRENLANAVSSISADELMGTTQSQTLSSSLYGKLTGANISANSGAPGGGISIKLRGVTTINGSSEPLYIVDGIYVNNDAIPNGSNAVTAAAAGGSASNQDNPANRIADLNPDEIESIEVLKGASAAAIYGQRASSGVVIIKTKRGKAGRAQFSVSQSLGYTTILKKLGSRTFTEQTAEDAFGATGLALYNEAISSGRGFLDYEELMYGHKGLLSKTNLSGSFGNENTSFYVSGSLQEDEGIIKTTGYNKQSIRSNIDHRFSDNLNLSISSNFIHSESNRGLTNNDNTGTTFGVSMVATPNFIDLRPDESGNYPDHPFNSANQLQTRDLFSNNEIVNRALFSANLDYNIINNSSSQLDFRFTGGLDFFSQTNKLIFPSELQFEQASGAPGTLIETKTDNLNINTSAILVYTYTPSSNLSMVTQSGITSFDNDQNRILNISNGVLGSQTNVDQAVSVNVDQTKIFQRDRGFFIQEEVNWRDTYIATLGLRGDKSDRNGDVNKVYLYPKASFAWNVTNEGFWNNEAIDNLKFRVAYGQTGNLATFGAKFTSLAPSNIGGLGGTLLTNTRGVENIKPERQQEIEGGFDIRLADGLASLEFTVYQKEIKDMLLQRELEPSTGFSFESFNSGEMRNRGVEIGLNLQPVSNPDFVWNSNINFWKNTSKVTDLPVPAFDVGGFGTSLGVYRIEEGKSATQIVGIDPQVDDNGNLVTDGSGNPVIVTKKLGDGEPDFQMSFGNEFQISKNFDFSFLFHWKKGGDVINLTELLFDLNGTTPDYDDTDVTFADFRNEAAGITDDTPNGIKRTSLLGISTDQFIQDGTYLRLREIGLYYTLPVALTSKLNEGIRNIRFGVSATNLLTFSPYRSYDPEVSNFGNQPIAQGIEVAPYPSSKQYYFHLKFDF
ncbi:MAG: SusC/RagA family TonB-linked outer membrane protein [Gracilimonas sp.]|uniref:SusC/RagA family TonB-linked outer membrane protein n=1 Tax=Gracilimonas sp. TaxID=1974203 RepID=UPI0019846401|nr:SusC/RagA family TonB-linked outer membrane protein [Gracilimonas sp.]MBD3616890.1 SusC/RagA family TonB-linked outer membrane protein [Gracilimonas sp.]